MFTPSVGCSRLLSAVNDLATTNLKIMSSTSFHSTATKRYWRKKKTNAISDTGRKESVQVVVLQIRGEDGAYLLLLLGSLIGVSAVHFCLTYKFFLFLSNSSVDGQQVKSFCANSSISMHFSSVQPILSSESRYMKSF